MYREKTTCEWVYIVRAGEFQLTKSILLRSGDGNTRQKRPATQQGTITANYSAMSELKKGRQSKMTVHHLPVMTAGPGNLLGEEDAVVGTYQVTVRCLSQVGRLYRMRREDFLKFQTQQNVWHALMM